MERTLRFLVVDPDVLERAILRRTLRRTDLNAQIREEATAAAGLEALRNEPFDCVLVDRRLPDRTGIDLLLRIDSARTCRPAIIFLTGWNEDSLGVSALRRGADDYLVKETLNVLSLQHAIRSALERRRVRSDRERGAQRLQEANAKLALEARTDNLTGIANRRAFRDRLASLLDEARRGRRFTMVMADVDHFKEFNDSFGHPVGDEVLIRVAKALARHVRTEDLAARYGGEEFALLLADVDENRALMLVERLRKVVAELPRRGGPLTMSFGLCSYRRGLDSPDALVRAADRALYAAKQAGRNRVIRYGDLGSGVDAPRSG